MKCWRHKHLDEKQKLLLLIICVCVWSSETRFLCVALTALELTL